MNKKNKKLLAATTVLACLFFLPSLASAVTVILTLDTFSPTSGIAPGTTNRMLGAWDLRGPNSEAIFLDTVSVGVRVTGLVTLQNLKLFINGTQTGNVFATPSTTNTFIPGMIIPAGLVDLLTVLGDVGFPGAGTIQVSILSGGISAVGVSSLNSYTGPSQPVSAWTQQVGTGDTAPEPETLSMLLGAAALGLGVLRRRRKG